MQMVKRSIISYVILALVCVIAIVLVAQRINVQTSTNAPSTLIAAYQLYKDPASRYEYVNSLWLADRKDDLLEIANFRLSTDKNDLGGLFLKFQHEADRMEQDKCISTLERIIAVLKGMDSGALHGKRDEFVRNLSFTQQGIASITRKQIDDDLRKQKSRKPLSMTVSFYLEELVKDARF